VTIKSYEITLRINGMDSSITLDDTFPSVEDWISACNMAVLMAKHVHPSKEIEFVSCSEYVDDIYEDFDYIAPASFTIH
jgi:hypothetical protein